MVLTKMAKLNGKSDLFYSEESIEIIDKGN